VICLWSVLALARRQRVVLALVLRLAHGPPVLLLLVPADAVSTTVVGTSARSAVGSAMHACNASGRCRSTYDGIGLIKRQRRAILCPLHGHRHRNQHQGSDDNGECLHWLSLSMRLTVGDYSPTALLRKLVLAALAELPGPSAVTARGTRTITMSAVSINGATNTSSGVTGTMALPAYVTERHRRAACVSLSRSRSVLGTWHAAEAMWIARWPGVTPSSSLGSGALRRLGAL
jgi:hypothetical protein